jgi:transposase
MKAYSDDLRRKVLDVIERGLNKSEAARLFGLSLSSVKRYAKMARGQAACPWDGARQAPQDRRARQAALGRLLQEASGSVPLRETRVLGAGRRGEGERVDDLPNIE